MPTNEVKVLLRRYEDKKHSVRMEADNETRGNWQVYVPKWILNELGVNGSAGVEVTVKAR